jgi:hypothetical protein
MGNLYFRKKRGCQSKSRVAFSNFKKPQDQISICIDGEDELYFILNWNNIRMPCRGCYPNGGTMSVVLWQLCEELPVCCNGHHLLHVELHDGIHVGTSA